MDPTNQLDGLGFDCAVAIYGDTCAIAIYGDTMYAKRVEYIWSWWCGILKMQRGMPELI